MTVDNKLVSGPPTKTNLFTKFHLLQGFHK